MKLKCIPDDFIVKEITQRQPSDGKFAFYELDKQSIGTLEALQIVRQTRNLAASQVSHGGLKDRHARTTQFVTIRNGPRADIGHKLFTLRYLGQTRTPVSADDVAGNRFRIVLRSLNAQEVSGLKQRQAVIREFGFPNYFDKQRFGSLGASEEFAAAAWCRKNYERAIWLALADHNRHDDRHEREQKHILRENWNDWAACKQQLSRSHRRSIVTYLVDHPQGFRKAFALIDPNLRGLYLSAFQSGVWNRMLAGVIGAGADAHMRIGDCDLPLPLQVASTATAMKLPLPSARCKCVTENVRQICDNALKHYNMSLTEMKISFPRDRWFARGERNAICLPAGISMLIEADDMYPESSKATLQFELPRGSYATMMIAALTCGQQTMTPSGGDESDA